MPTQKIPIAIRRTIYNLKSVQEMKPEIIWFAGYAVHPNFLGHHEVRAKKKKKV